MRLKLFLDRNLWVRIQKFSRKHHENGGDGGVIEGWQESQENSGHGSVDHHEDPRVLKGFHEDD